MNQITKTDLTTVIDKAVDKGIDPATLGQLLDVQERLWNREAEQAYNISMRNVQSKTPRVLKDKRNQQTNSNYSSLESLVAAIKPVYTDEGFSLEFDTDKSPIENHIRILCKCSHIGGYSRPFKLDLPVDATGIKGTINKTPTHASGSTLSYGRRYLTLMIFNVATGDDTDGNLPNDPISEEQANDLIERTGKLDKKTSDRFFSWMTKHTGASTIQTIPGSKLSSVLNTLSKAEKS